MIVIVFKLMTLGAFVVMAMFALASVFKTSRTLNKRIVELRAEEERTGAVKNPYGEMAEICRGSSGVHRDKD